MFNKLRIVIRKIRERISRQESHVTEGLPARENALVFRNYPIQL